jgi:hypothetical protein
MSAVMEEEITRWTARRKSQLVPEIHDMTGVDRDALSIHPGWERPLAHGD